jgi:hypothetical protein
VSIALRTALIWRDEVMDDVVSHKPANITLGDSGGTTFTVPSVGLPKGFAIVRPGNRGYVLTLGERMRGTICLDGEQKDVAEFVRRGGEGEGVGPGGFRGTPISGKDWGVIDLDESGDYKLFFQFVQVEDAQPFLSGKVLTAGVIGWLVSAIALSFVLLDSVKTQYIVLGSEQIALGLEAATLGAALATGALGLAGLVWWLFKQDGDQQASFGFSVVLHAALLFMTYQLYDGTDPFAWPGPRALTGNYLVTRLEPEEPPEPPKQSATVGQKVDTGAAAPKSPEKPKNTATKNDEGAAGGSGEHERARDPNAKDEPPAPPKIGVFEDKNRKVLDNIIDRNLSTSLDKFAGIKGDEFKRGDLGYGSGHGTGVGDGTGTGTTRGSKGKGTGGGGNAEGDYVSKKGKIDTGKDRPGGGNCAKPPCGTGPKEVAITLKNAEGEFNGLTLEEIMRVVNARKNILRACYQQELNRQPSLAGTLIVAFQIGGDGIVKSAKVNSASSLRNAAVESCVTRNIMHLKFPAKGGLSNVKIPLKFDPGGG